MKNKLFLLITIFSASILIWTLAGCSAFSSPPRLARIQIKGPANQTNEVVIALDNSVQRDIQLSDRYAVRLTLQWLWYEREDLNFIKESSENGAVPLTPWFICKYRF